MGDFSDPQINCSPKGCARSDLEAHVPAGAVIDSSAATFSTGCEKATVSSGKTCTILMDGMDCQKARCYLGAITAPSLSRC